MTSARPPRSAGTFGLGMARDDEESTADGIYGVIVSAAVMAASHAETAVALAAAVLITLAIYWGAERYARLVAERIHNGHRPNRAQVRRQLTSGWEIVTASALPLVAPSTGPDSVQITFRASRTPSRPTTSRRPASSGRGPRRTRASRRPRRRSGRPPR